MAYSYDSVATLISDTARELGLVSADISDPYASTDPNILQMLSLLKSVGRNISRLRQWTQLQNEYTFATVASTASYDLPSDFRAMIDQTHWNRDTQWPLLGPDSPQRWQYLQALTGDVIYGEFRPKAGKLYLTPTPSAAETIAYEYVSVWWASATAGTVPTKEAPTVATDLVFFDPHLVTRALKLEFLKAKGMDTTAAQQDYEIALDQAKGDNAPSPALSLNGGADFHLLDGSNLPDTGYG